VFRLGARLTSHGAPGARLRAVSVASTSLLGLYGRRFYACAAWAQVLFVMPSVAAQSMSRAVQAYARRGWAVRASRGCRVWMTCGFAPWSVCTQQAASIGDQGHLSLHGRRLEALRIATRSD